MMRERLTDLPGIAAPKVAAATNPSGYGFILQYRRESLSDRPVERFYGAVKAEGCHAVDRPALTCPLNTLPLFQGPAPPHPTYAGRLS